MGKGEDGAAWEGEKWGLRLRLLHPQLPPRWQQLQLLLPPPPPLLLLLLGPVLGV